MSRTLVQPVGQKRLTNVAVVRLKKHGMRFEIACYPNTVLSWRSGVEKDLDEVLQSHTVYSNVSKGVLAKSKDLIAAFGTDDQTNICLDILKKGELQVAGKERESLLSSQFRDIATIVMHKTYNTETQRPYTISMIERLMREIHFAVDPHSTSKKQALELIQELQKHFPIKRCPLRIRATAPQDQLPNLLEKLKEWNATVISKEGSSAQLSVVFEMEPGLYKDCHDFVMNKMHGRFEVLAHSLYVEGDTHVDQYNDYEDMPAPLPKETHDSVVELNEKLQKQTISSTSRPTTEGQQKQNKCNTCNVSFDDSKLYRDHHKSEWHKHNMKRKTRQLPPLTEEECMADMELGDSKSDLKDYSF
ncbi:ribosome maturation protein SBDS [Vigna radiata var. radiata]|uniref:Ribosome maturation protein SBDS n=1 Tax=Vigna radiata var. radiata TaxID=3916 RepID=A0A1S3TEC0_VIGRR|nr:ribosome maturation protein SBDS [Vigna radiata var. radiata]XP_014492103.1 ribosome maturation protein SBDS [Vigna radiata var. radiata]XP_014492105.1 ribosome maturation protein SBDS [Vigna radiata var. radiata]XP_014492107.1 ribosome maturation protein SBDS [Vigna radiata var. radiata]XP_022633713.1 ribosome maturation protein SBDS [Vigna radiata var. radiata]XP_022633714.1 ribosome maturation protein SBDS [Vigna radiata var. radiata]XP_022633715.1 ribosome maturation protein SBDS [Vign